MNFNGKKAIYLQIADYICDKVLLGEYKEEERVPSVRETAADVEVNSNTVMRAYDWLQSHDIIYTKRGLGYFVSTGAQQAIQSLRKTEFVEESVPDLLRTMQTLGIGVDELTQLLTKANKQAV
ncbi:MAG: GntR family transcriptional regulator [Bacteroidaceae bacterium]|nr:GntR family transcriptional regulator [Bacteroidaceae bacterium]MBQ9175838.1 GntR family transcriptional regulator [Bacteroidaceae bacterium]MBR1379272.1 GntR family transcriptional regulator [Bacteroidaceae bacterium]